MFGNVLIGVDGRDGGRQAIALAQLLAEPHASFALANVYQTKWPRGGIATVAAEAERVASRQLLRHEREQAGIDATLHTVAAPSVARGLHAEAKRWPADLIVVGSCHRRVLGRLLRGDDTRAVMRSATIPVAVAQIHGELPKRLTRIGIGHDNSPETIRGLAVARALVRRTGAELSAMSVVSLASIPYGEPIPRLWPAVAADMLEGEAERLDALRDVHGDVAYGDPADELLRFAEDLDLLIVGSRGLAAFQRLTRGSTSEFLAARVNCPLLVVPRGARVSTLEPPFTSSARMTRS